MVFKLKIHSEPTALLYIESSRFLIYVIEYSFYLINSILTDK